MTSDTPIKQQRHLFLLINSKNTDAPAAAGVSHKLVTHFKLASNLQETCPRAPHVSAAPPQVDCAATASPGVTFAPPVSILGVKMNHLAAGGQTLTRLSSVLLKARRCVSEGGTLERQVFVTQGGEALLHHLGGHVLQRGGVPLGTVVLVYQHCGR